MTLNAEDNSVLNVLPVGMHNSALVLKDEDGNSVVTDLEELSCGSEQLAPAAINVENSSDVIIGPVTQFNGPVTIYQNVTGSSKSLSEKSPSDLNGYLNGKLVKSESTSSDTLPQQSEKHQPTTKSLLNARHLKYFGILLLVLIIAAVITTATVISLKTDKDLPKPKPAAKPDNNVVDGNDVLKPAGPGLIIPKKDWGGRPALNWTQPLHHPTPFVIISHTATPQCTSFDACCLRVQSIQNFHVSSGKSPDIGYNFLIGGDGNAYVGRGWDIQNFHKNNSIGICFIGNYVYDFLKQEMIDVAVKLLDEGVKNGKLSKDYTLVAHNQTYPTESPGAHLYEVIKKWPHFKPDRFL